MNRIAILITILLGLVATPTLSRADDWTVVYTPRNTPVLAEKRTFELSTSEIAGLNQWVAYYYPLAVRETNASRKFNCHSYAWHNQSTTNDIWISTPNDDTYWQDGSYQLIASVNGGLPIPAYIANGAKVSYSDSDHSAIKVSSTQFRSKWGQYPRMLHSPGYCPYGCGPASCVFCVRYYQ